MPGLYSPHAPAWVAAYDRRVQLSWKISMVILVAALLASIVIAVIKLA